MMTTTKHNEAAQRETERLLDNPFTWALYRRRGDYSHDVAMFTEYDGDDEVRVSLYLDGPETLTARTVGELEAERVYDFYLREGFARRTVEGVEVRS